ncbi:zinc finger protein 836 [Betta splendens]|uniref:Zinc finger protein 836 n=1 Tax=Betta splendens TaxID=158456 RepID=A0A6P7KVS8_BETSP|nr:zinc finger protein 836 [Betta splendens]
MSENLSSDEEWCVYNHNTHRNTKCWECGKTFSKLETLMSHYRSHNILATCHICNLVFRRQTSLSTHLDNAHSPALCKKCHQSFSNVWELNKHAETQCFKTESFQEASTLTSTIIHESHNSTNSSGEVTTLHSSVSGQPGSMSEMRSQQKTERTSKKLESSENSVEFTVGEDDTDFDSDSEASDESETSDSDNYANAPSKLPKLSPVHSESDSDSSTTDCSSDSSNSVGTHSNVNLSLCAVCGRGPFKSLKLHMLHCSGVKVKYQCLHCKKVFLTEASFKEHYMLLYSCNICNQVFSHEYLYNCHQCPKDGKSPLVLFCSETMPKVCNICKSFYTCEKALLNHVTRAHTSVVSTKVCIVSKQSGLKEQNVSCGTVQSVTRSPNLGSQVFNGKRHVSQTYAGSSPSPLLAPSSNPGSSSGVIHLESIKPGLSKNQPLRNPSTHLLNPPGAVEKVSTTTSSKTVSPPMPTIMAMFENGSHALALMKRMNTGWRFKAQYPCRQCGAIFRQPSLIISHRYLHRGRRSHHCQCGRAFKHRLHLLRHCVQHAEAVSYICVSCGDTFTGARLLAEHIQGNSRKRSSSGSTWKDKVKPGCAVPFTCDCGQLFFRPSAYIWHQLKNLKK